MYKRQAQADSFAIQEELAFLSVVNTPGGEIDGMLITDHAASLKALDERESLYSRVTLNAENLHLHDDSIELKDRFLYVANEIPIETVPIESKILRSYLDVVMQGYLNHFGEDGLKRFFATTLNFDLDILEDRKEPLYPRATTLSAEEKTLFAKFR